MFISFNSTLVQLKAVLVKFDSVSYRRFNSTLVQLKEIKQPMSKEIINRFNSTLVQLKGFVWVRCKP